MCWGCPPRHFCEAHNCGVTCVRVSRGASCCGYFRPARASSGLARSWYHPSGMGRKKSSKLGEDEEEEVEVEEEDGGPEEEESGSEWEVDDEEEDSGEASEREEEDIDDPDFGDARKRKRGGGGGGSSGGGGGGKKTARNKKPATAAPAGTPSPTSEFRGVTWAPGPRRWRTRFRHNGKLTNLGCFDTDEGAARAYDRMAVWCALRGLERLLPGSLPGGKGGGSHTSVSFKKEDLNFDYGEYEGELDMLRGITQDELVLQLRRGERPRAPTSSKLRGVSWKSDSRRWKAQFKHNGKLLSLGCFDTEEDAARSFDRMAVSCELHGVERQGGWKLNFSRADYEGESEELRGITVKDLVEKLRQQGREQRAATNNADGDKAGERRAEGAGMPSRVAPMRSSWARRVRAAAVAGAGAGASGRAPTPKPGARPLLSR